MPVAPMPLLRRPAALILAALFFLTMAAPAGAHHVTDFVITSSEDGSGQLLIVLYPFDRTVAPMSFSHTEGGLSVYTGTDPGFDVTDGDEFKPDGSTYPLIAPGATITVEITGIDEGKTAMKLRDVLLKSVGDKVVLGTRGAPPPNDFHHHPEWTLYLMLPEGEFGEATISFKLTSDAYTESPSYTLRLSNAHLGRAEYRVDQFDKAGVACRDTVAKEVGGFTAKAYAAFRKCATKIEILKASEAAHLDLTKPTAVAEKTCADSNGTGADTKTLIGTLAALRAKAAAAITKKCGPTGANAFDDDAINAHLGMVQCRVEGMVAAAYFRIFTDLKAFPARPAQGGKPLNEYFPCLVKTAGEEEVE